MKRLIRFCLNHIPRPVLQRIAGWAVPVVGLLYRGRGVECPVCGSHYRRFLPYGYVSSRPNALCPHCLSLERHRLLWLYLTRETDLLERFPRTLHIAPEVCIMRHLKPHFAAHPGQYLTADLESPLADLHFDVQQIPLADDSVEVILCNHLLEHVADDRKALRELHASSDSTTTGASTVRTTPTDCVKRDSTPWRSTTPRRSPTTNAAASPCPRTLSTWSTNTEHGRTHITFR